MFKSIIRKIFNQFNLDITRLNKTPHHTLLGLRSQPISTIIDVGANKGQFARYVRGVFPQAQVY